MNQLIQQVEANIQRTGWSVIAVNGDPTINMPIWAYTVGIERTLGHSELVMSGLPPETMQPILNNIGMLIRNGAYFIPGIQADNVLQNYQVAFRTVHYSWYTSLFGVARRIYGHWEFQMLQVLYPDSAGRFPWEASCMTPIRERQPRLDLPMGRIGIVPTA